MANQNFSTLDSLYRHIEKEATNFRYDYQIDRYFRKLTELKKKENENDEAQKAQWEVDFFNFVIDNGKLRPKFISTNEKGQQVEYPSLQGFTDETYSYLKKRAESTNNHVLRARYFHILWLSPKKHHEYAKRAIDSYFDLIYLFEKKDKELPEQHYGLRVLEIMKNLLSLCFQLNHKVEDATVEIKRIIKNYNRTSTSSFKLRFELINFMLDQKRRFSKDDYQGIEEVCWTVAEDLTKSGNVFEAIDMLYLGERIDQKLEKKSHIWDERIAQSHEKLMEMASSNLVASTHCVTALECYKILKNDVKVKELEKKYSEIKSSLEMSKITPPPEVMEQIKKLIEHSKESAKEVVNRTPQEIINFLMLSPDLIPTYDEIKKRSKDHAEQFILQYLFPATPIDQSGHTVQHFVEEDEKEYYGILKELGNDLKFNQVLIDEIFINSIRENKLTFDELLGFLQKNSWFGKTLIKKLPNSKTIKYNWLNLLAPSLQEYFVQVQHHLKNPNFRPVMILCVDSLTLKLEGLLRDICELSNVSTFYTTKDKKGRPIGREKDIHALLYEEPVKKLFSKDDLLFFKYLLVEKMGYNLRHKVAHSLMLYQEYSISYMHLLILALLRFGKYDFVDKHAQPNA